MIKYRNLGGNSGVSAYEIGEQYIRVRFTSGAIYTYSYLTAGSSNVEQMKGFASRGKGLNTFISKYVKNRYE